MSDESAYGTPWRLPRWLVRAPIPVFLAGLGAVFAGRLLLVEHHGRVTGRRRYVVLEVAGRPRRDCYQVTAGFGPSTQWLRNVRADPRVRVWVGTRRAVPGRARVLDEAVATRALADYARRHPRVARSLGRFLTGGRSLRPQQFAELATVLPVVELELAGTRSLGA